MRDINVTPTDSPIHIDLRDMFRDFIHIEIANKNDNRNKNSNYKRITTSESKLIPQMIQLLPSLMPENASGEAIRLFFPEGIASVLAAMRNGTFPAVADMLEGIAGSTGLLLPLESIGTAYSLLLNAVGDHESILSATDQSTAQRHSIQAGPGAGFPVQ